MGQKNPQADCLCLWYKFLAFFYRGRKQSNLSSFQNRVQRYYKKCTYASKASIIFKKDRLLSIEYDIQHLIQASMTSKSILTFLVLTRVRSAYLQTTYLYLVIS